MEANSEGKLPKSQDLPIACKNHEDVGKFEVEVAVPGNIASADLLLDAVACIVSQAITGVATLPFTCGHGPCIAERLMHKIAIRLKEAGVIDYVVAVVEDEFPDSTPGHQHLH